MQQHINPNNDIIAYVLEAVIKARPDDAFCKSIQLQYMERGGLSKKQLEGLLGKAVRIPGIHPGRVATLEAIIKKKHVTQRSEVTITKIEEEKDTASENMIVAILEKYPQHKMVLVFKSLFEKDGKLSALEKTALERFHKILIKK